MFERLLDDRLFMRYGEKLSLSRFFSMIYVQRREDAQWCKRTLALQYIGLQLGFTDTPTALAAAGRDVVQPSAPSSA